MPDKFRNKYRIATTRLQTWDYGANALYFVTICTHNRKHYFGEIINGEMGLSEIGGFAQQFWDEIPVHFPFVQLGAFVVMPNHVHGIIHIHKTDEINKMEPDGKTTKMDNLKTMNAPDQLQMVVETPNLGVSTITTTTNAGNSNDIPTNHNRKQTINASQKWQPHSLGVIINQYKRMVTIHARKINREFAWQSRFNDHIIRNHQSFQRISNYIRNNPTKWNDDQFYQT